MLHLRSLNTHELTLRGLLLAQQLGATPPSGDHGEDGNDKSDEDDVSAPEGYSMLVGCDEASDSDEGDDAADGNHADTDVNKCAQEPTETSLGERGTSQQALCASSGATAIASTAAQPGISNDTDCDTGSLGGDATERRANHARMDAETAASIRTVMTDFVLPAPEWARGLDVRSFVPSV